MAMLIDAENLLNQYERIDWYSVSKKGQFMRGATTEDNPFIHYYDGEEIIKNAPTIDAVPARHGKWEPGNPICPVCGGNKFKDLDADIWCDWMPDFCPNCGAKMDGGAE